ncbi:MAG: peroxide stress protein YaaA [Terrimesophilobacter sp.]
MHILLPPSETKRDGGIDGTVLDLHALSFSELTSTRRSVLSAVRSLCSNRAEAAAALGLSKAQYFEIERNRELRRSATMPALDRYTGVLFDALDAGSLPQAARAFAGEQVVIHSALFGLIGAFDPIPAYRLSQDSRLPGLSLKKSWQGLVSRELRSLPGLVLDLRSESYVGLGQAPESATFVRVVTAGADGARRALNHFNKKAKGEFVRALALAQIDHPDLDSLVAWAKAQGIQLDHGSAGELQLVV